MGDLFFVLKMMIFTIIITLVMQVKVGQTTLENKVIDLTHKSQIAITTQKMAEGGIAFISHQYRKITGNINIPFFQKASSSQKPGQRLKTKIEEIKASIKDGWSTQDSKINEQVEEYSDELE